MKFDKPISLKEIENRLNHKLQFRIEGNIEINIEEINPIENYNKNSLIFLNNKKFLHLIKQEIQPVIVVTTEEIYQEIKELLEQSVFIISPTVDIFRAIFLQEFCDRNLFKNYCWERIHKTAVVHESVHLPEDVIIGPNVIIEKDVIIENHVYIGANCIIEEGAKIGSNTILYPNVYIGWGCIIGKNCIIHPGTIIGSEGFGFAQDKDFNHYRIPQLGIVEIEDNVVIGANCCIDRAAYDKTIIRKGVITDNFVHVAHNCEVGENSILVAQVGIAGSSKLGKKVICSGQVGISDHVHIPDNTILLARTAVLDSILESGVYMGYPAIPAMRFQRLQIHYNKLDEYAKEIKNLCKRIEELEKKWENS
ncbi:MAG: UDP-3-O-acylglucosamine N-acyltransferase [Leptospiraceae bacterium]|nr:MAG: UDP-3-O-acylglucosamine N-acyltransferase [Leptospiraceae bacterium]